MSVTTIIVAHLGYYAVELCHAGEGQPDSLSLTPIIAWKLSEDDGVILRTPIALDWEADGCKVILAPNGHYFASGGTCFETPDDCLKYLMDEWKRGRR